MVTSRGWKVWDERMAYEMAISTDERMGYGMATSMG